MSGVVTFPASRKPADGPVDSKSETIREAVKKLVGGLSRAEQESLLGELTEWLHPIPTPRAGRVLGAVVELLPQKRDWHVSDVKAEIAEKGIRAKPKEIYNALGYLARKGRVRRVGYGRYLVEGALFETVEDLGGEPGRYETDDE